MAGNINSADPLNSRCVNEAVCVHTGKIFDSCMDKDCIEDLRLCIGPISQAIVNASISVRPRSAELLHADVRVEDINFNRGCYTVDVTYFYKVRGEAFPGGCTVSGLAIFEKRVILYGGEGGSKIYSSDGSRIHRHSTSLPTAVVEAVDPLPLSMRISDAVLADTSDSELQNIPAEISECFDEEIVNCPVGKQLYVTLGQFSIIRLERDTQLCIPAYDYCIPEKECVGGEEDPCALFASIPFPINDFFPPRGDPSQCLSAETT